MNHKKTILEAQLHYAKLRRRRLETDWDMHHNDPVCREADARIAQLEKELKELV